MGSEIIGRRPCLLGCGHEKAHVKKSERCTYMYCPGCGLNGPHARTAHQVALMTQGMTPEGAQHPPGVMPTAPSPTPTPTGAKPADKPAAPPSPTPTPTPTPQPAKRGGLFTL